MLLFRSFFSGYVSGVELRMFGAFFVRFPVLCLASSLRLAGTSFSPSVPVAVVKCAINVHRPNVPKLIRAVLSG